MNSTVLELYTLRINHFKHHNRNVTGCHLLVIQIRRMLLRSKVPQADVLVSLCVAGFNGNRFSVHGQLRTRVFEEIQIPIRVFVLSPIRRDDQIFPFVEEIRNWYYARLSRFAPNRFEQGDGLRAEFGADPPIGDVDEEGVEVRE